MDISKASIAYSGYSEDLVSPGDRRRFPQYAKLRGLKIEAPLPNKTYDLIYVTHGGDISRWSSYQKKGTKLVYELIDSYLDPPNIDLKSILRGTVKYLNRDYRRLYFSINKLIRIMCLNSDAVVCSTLEQRDVLNRYCNNVHEILDFKSFVRRTKHNYEIENTIHICWEGLPGQVETLKEVAVVLSKINQRYDIALHVVTSLKYGKYMGRYFGRDTKKEISKILGNIKTYLYDWNEYTFDSILGLCDIAVIPLRKGNYLDFGKPTNKLHIFWLVGLPVVTSSSPALTRAMEETSFNLVCADDDEWIRKLSHMINNKNARELAANEGYQLASSYSADETLVTKWDELFDSL